MPDIVVDSMIMLNSYLETVVTYFSVISVIADFTLK